MNRRYHVYDEVGLLRSFWTLEEATRFINHDPNLILKIDPRPKKVSPVDWSNFEPALF